MIGSLLVFLVVLVIVVIFHEFGHYIIAKKSGILVEEFGFGIPPRIFGKKLGETIYSLNLFPFGGFVRLHGESSDEKINNPKRAFLNKSKKVRALVVVAGVVMNFILAIIAFAIVYSFTGIPRDTGVVKIASVSSNSPAETSGIKEGDVISKVNYKPINDVSKFIEIVSSNRGKQIALTITSSNNEKVVELTPRENPPKGEGALGVLVTSTETYFPPIWQRPFLGAFYGFKEAVFWGGAIVQGLLGLFQNLFKGQIPKDVGGPVIIYALTTKAASLGVLTLIDFIGVLSVNLGILNIVPIPPFDGGRLLFIGLEGLLGKKMVSKAEGWINTIGMALLIIFVLLLTTHDIRQIISAGGISAYINTILK